MKYLKYFTDAQMKDLWHFIDQDNKERYNLLFETLAATGARQDELVKIKLRHVNLLTGRITIHKASKGSNPRSFNVGLSLVTRLHDACDEAGIGPEHLIMDLISRGTPETRKRALRTRFEAVKRYLWPQQDLPGLHGLRHTKAKRINDQTHGNSRAIQQGLGHASLRSTEIYIPMFLEDKLQEIMSKR